MYYIVIINKMDKVIDTIPQVPIEYYNNKIEQIKKKSIIDKFLDKDLYLEMDTFIPGCILFVSLATINIQLSLFYTILFVNFTGYKNTKYEIYHNFMMASIFIFGYLLLIILCLSIIDMTGGVNLHPNSSERPYFYFM